MDGQTGQFPGRQPSQDSIQTMSAFDEVICESCEGTGRVLFSEREIKQLIRDMLARNSAVLFSDFRALLEDEAAECPICRGAGTLPADKDERPPHPSQRRH